MRRLSTFSLLVLCACGSAPPGEVDDCTRNLAVPRSVKTDVLFVIDDSRSMEQEQARVVEELGRFVSVLMNGPVDDDFQVGVITTDVSSNVSSCSGGDPRFTSYDVAGHLQPVTDEPGAPTIIGRDDPEFIAHFGALVTRGIRGSAQEMPLEAAMRALSPGVNPGFLRPGARLLVVIVSDEDDCSDPTGTVLSISPACGSEPTCRTDGECGGDGAYCTEAGNRRVCLVNSCDTRAGRALLRPVQEYVDFLKGLGREVSLAVIGPFDPRTLEPARCTSEGDEANGTGVRLAEAVRAFGDAGLAASICDPSYGEALEGAALLVAVPRSVTYPDAPADGRLLSITIERGDSNIACRMDDGFRYARSGADATVTFEGRCRLAPGDRIVSRLFCAG